MSSLVNEFVTKGMRTKKASINSQKSYRNHLGQFEKYLTYRGKKPADGSVTEQDILDFVEHMKEMNYSANTLCSKTAAIKSYFRFLKTRGIVAEIPTIKLTRPAKITRQPVDEKDVQTILQYLTNHDTKEVRDAAILALLAYCDLKTEQVMNLKLADIDLRLSTVRHRSLKQAAPFVAKYLQMRPNQNAEPDSPLFLNKDFQGMSSRSFRRHLHKYMGHLNMPNRFETRDLKQTLKASVE